MAEQEAKRKGIVIKKPIDDKSLSMPVGFTDPEELYKKLIETVYEYRPGTDISMIEKAYLDSAEKGQVKEITFTQKMSLQGGEYLLSLGVTGYEGDKFEVYHRLYDALNITVVSDKDTVGFYDMGSVITVQEGQKFRIVGE